MRQKPDGLVLMCIGCNKTPEEILEYQMAAEADCTTSSTYVWEEEGTLNRENGHFLCTDCYILAGMPTSSRGWTAP